MNLLEHLNIDDDWTVVEIGIFGLLIKTHAWSIAARVDNTGLLPLFPKSLIAITWNRETSPAWSIAARVDNTGLLPLFPKSLIAITWNRETSPGRRESTCLLSSRDQLDN